MVNCEGWTCPACRRNYAPWVPSCNCIDSAVGVSATSITITPHADEAAELREETHTLRTEADGWIKRIELLEAAIREWVEATDDAEMFELDQTNAYGTDHVDAEHRVEVAAQALRRLVGEGES